MTDETKRITFEVPADQKEMLDEIFDHGELTEQFREVTEKLIEANGYVNEKTVYDVQIAQLENELDHVRRQRDEWDQRADDIADEISDLREKRDNMTSTADEYRGALKALERDLRRRGDPADKSCLRHIWPDHPRIRGVADEYHKNPDTVLEDLRERNPDVPEKAFKQGIYANGEPFDGLPADQARLPVEERDGYSGGDGKC